MNALGIDHRRFNRLILFAPARQNLCVAPAVDRAVQRGGERRRQPVALFGGHCYPRAKRPAAHQPRLAVKRCLICRDRMGAKLRISPPGEQAQGGGGVVG